MDLSDKRIIVTGGARGMGAATVRAYVRAGARVVSMDPSDEDGHKVVDDPDRDLGPVMLFLASDGSRFITGQLIPVDGGQSSVR